MARDKGRLALITLAFALAIPAGASASNPSLPHGPGPEPGPALLHKNAPKPAPQLRNRGPWKAKPLLVSGASAYVAGEFIYQDYIYDDHGAQADQRDPSDPRADDDTFSAPNGTYTYPTDVERYRNNVADLVELRVKPRRSATLVRLTFNSMTKPGLVATTIALGDSGQPVELPFGAGASAPAEDFLFVRGTRASLLAPGEESGENIRSKVSKRRRQITVSIPKKAWNPGSDTVRMAAATGLWDKAAKSYLQPGDEATETKPGGAGGLSDPTALFNVAFRFDEPLPVIDPGALTDTAWWRENQQGASLAENDISPFFAEIDFGKLRSGVTDRMKDKPTGVPTTGPINRILSSRFTSGQGVQHVDADCGDPNGCPGQYLDRLQPYSLYVPDKPVPDKGRGLTLLLHSLGGSFNQFHGTRNQSQFGDRGKGHIVITSGSRGPDGWYYGLAGAEVFEVWADVARRYELDPRKSAITGYSMGGYGTYKLATQFPDLFASGQPTVGPPGLGIWIPGTPAQPARGSNTNAMLASLRHVPFMIWNGVEDELVPYAGALEQGQTFAELGLDHIFDSFLTAEHFTFAINDEYGPAADFLGERTIEENPPRVTYVRNPSMDFKELGTKADGAYWVGGVKTRGKGVGTIDAFSKGFGRAKDEPGPTETSAGVLTGGTIPALTFQRQSLDVEPGGARPKADKLELDADNISRVEIHVKQARLSCNPKITGTFDGPLEVELVGCPGPPLEIAPAP